MSNFDEVRLIEAQEERHSSIIHTLKYVYGIVDVHLQDCGSTKILCEPHNGTIACSKCGKVLILWESPYENP